MCCPDLQNQSLLRGSEPLSWNTGLQPPLCSLPDGLRALRSRGASRQHSHSESELSWQSSRSHLPPTAKQNKTDRPSYPSRNKWISKSPTLTWREFTIKLMKLKLLPLMHDLTPNAVLGLFPCRPPYSLDSRPFTIAYCRNFRAAFNLSLRFYRYFSFFETVNIQRKHSLSYYN